MTKTQIETPDNASLREALKEIGEKIKECGNTGTAVWVQDRVSQALAREPNTGTAPKEDRAGG